MSVRETQELEVAAQKLSLDTLKKSLEVNGGEAVGRKEELLHRIGNKVLEIGLEGFLDGLGKESVKDLCDRLRPKEGSGGGGGASRKKENPKAKLFRHILEKGLEYFLQDCAREQLNNFCSVLLLEQSSNDAMVSQIADEVMLTGTKKFLHNLPVPLLKKWCSQLGLKPAAAKKQLVEQLMVHIFELEPLDEEEQEEEDEGEAAEGDGGKKQDKKARPGEKGRGGEEEEEGEEEKPKEGGKGIDAAVKKEQGSKREKYVPPPISTIKKGMTKEHLHNTFNATDLKEFCKQNNMTASGKKPVLIKRILKFLETGEIEAPKAKARRGAKRKRPASEKSSSGKRTKSNEPLEGHKDDDNEEEEEEEDDDEEDEGDGSAKQPRNEDHLGEMRGDKTEAEEHGAPSKSDDMRRTVTQELEHPSVPEAESTAKRELGPSEGAHENGDAKGQTHSFTTVDVDGVGQALESVENPHPNEVSVV